jgi:hypothetical protein
MRKNGDCERMTPDAIADELRAWARGDIRHMGGWEGELAREKWSETKSAYNRRYRLRHPERIRAMQKVYKARLRAKQLGLEPPPIPDWDQELSGFEVVFARGRVPEWGLTRNLTHCRSGS